MRKRPAYLKNKKGSYWVVLALLAVLVWLVYGYGSDFSLQQLVEESELQGRRFQGKTEEVFVPELGIKFYFMREDSNPLVAVSFIFEKAGTAYDLSSEQGLAAQPPDNSY